MSNDPTLHQRKDPCVGCTCGMSVLCRPASCYRTAEVVRLRATIADISLALRIIRHRTSVDYPDGIQVWLTDNTSIPLAEYIDRVLADLEESAE